MEVNPDDSDSGLEEEISEKEGKRAPYNNQDSMLLKLQQLKNNLEWLQHLSVTTDLKDIPLSGVDDNDQGLKTDIQDDFKREMLFYCQAQVAAKEALSKLRDIGIPTERPVDYFAEMVKSDTHMQKIRQKLVQRKESMEKSEKAKKQRQLKKIGKKVQQEVLQKRREEKKNMLQAVDRIKKGKNKFERLDQHDDIFDISTENKRSQATKRKRKDEKFGFGGKKRKMKKNSAGSSGDMMSFKSDIHGKARNINQQKFGNKNSKSKRLGKSRRLKAHGKKK